MEYTVYVSMTVPFRVAVMVASPSSMPVTTPLLSTVATAGLLEDQTMLGVVVRGLSPRSASGISAVRVVVPPLMTRTSSFERETVSASVSSVGVWAAGTASGGVSASWASATGAVCVCYAREFPGRRPNSKHTTSAKANFRLCLFVIADFSFDIVF